MGGTQSSEDDVIDDNRVYGRDYVQMNDFVEQFDKDVHREPRNMNGDHPEFVKLPTLTTTMLQDSNVWHKFKGDRQIPVAINIPGFGTGIAAAFREGAYIRGAPGDPRNSEASGLVYCVYKLYPFNPKKHQTTPVFKEVPEFFGKKRIVWPIKSAVDAIFLEPEKKVYFVTALGERFSYPLNEALSVDPKRDPRGIATAIAFFKGDYLKETGFEFSFKPVASPPLHIIGEDKIQELEAQNETSGLQDFSTPEEMYQQYASMQQKFKNTPDKELDKLAKILSNKQQKQPARQEKPFEIPAGGFKSDQNDSTIARLAAQNGVSMSELLEENYELDGKVFEDNEVAPVASQLIGSSMSMDCNTGCGSSSSISTEEMLQALQGQTGFANIGSKMKKTYCKTVKGGPSTFTTLY